MTRSRYQYVSICQFFCCCCLPPTATVTCGLIYWCTIRARTIQRVFFTLNRSFYSSTSSQLHPAHPVSALILHPTNNNREIQALWPAGVDQLIRHCCGWSVMCTRQRDRCQPNGWLGPSDWLRVRVTVTSIRIVYTSYSHPQPSSTQSNRIWGKLTPPPKLRAQKSLRNILDH